MMVQVATCGHCFPREVELVKAKLSKVEQECREAEQFAEDARERGDWLHPPGIELELGEQRSAQEERDEAVGRMQAAEAALITQKKVLQLTAELEIMSENSKILDGQAESTKDEIVKVYLSEMKIELEEAEKKIGLLQEKYKLDTEEADRRFNEAVTSAEKKLNAQLEENEGHIEVTQRITILSELSMQVLCHVHEEIDRNGLQIEADLEGTEIDRAAKVRNDMRIQVKALESELQEVTRERDTLETRLLSDAPKEMKQAFEDIKLKLADATEEKLATDKSHAKKVTALKMKTAAEIKQLKTRVSELTEDTYRFQEELLEGAAEGAETRLAQQVRDLTDDNERLHEKVADLNQELDYYVTTIVDSRDEASNKLEEENANLTLALEEATVEKRDAENKKQKKNKWSKVRLFLVCFSHYSSVQK